MTAEVAILNRTAVALAADSAVTIGGGRKTYNSVNKLFGLSKYEPVGVMVYGTASLDRVPWETILKECRRDLGRTSFPTLRDYAEYLLAYLTDNAVLFPKEAQVTGVKDMATAFLREVKATAFRRAAERGELLEKALEACLRAVNQSLAKCAFTSGYSSENAHASVEPYAATLEGLIPRVLGEISVSDELGKDARLSLELLLTRDHKGSEHSEIVVAGFGTKEVFPSVVSFPVYLITDGKPRVGSWDESTITVDNGAVVHAFAQRDLVATFMEGVDPTYEQYLESVVGDVILDLYPALLAQALTPGAGAERDSLKEKIAEIGAGVVAELESKLEAHRAREHVRPVVAAVEVLPKDDLADLAESLVSLTSLKRRVTLDTETVGGPIDVVVISKGDGLIWMKRKHYFRPELNPHFFSNYFKESEDARPTSSSPQSGGVVRNGGSSRGQHSKNSGSGGRSDKGHASGSGPRPRARRPHQG